MEEGGEPGDIVGRLGGDVPHVVIALALGEIELDTVVERGPLDLGGFVQGENAKLQHSIVVEGPRQFEERDKPPLEGGKGGPRLGGFSVDARALRGFGLREQEPGKEANAARQLAAA